MRRRDPTSTCPPPLLVTCNQQHVRLGLLQQKFRLANIEKYCKVFINPDEPIEVRRNKASFRKIAAKARSDGKTVIYRDDWIQIDETTYQVSELCNTPEAYMPTVNNAERMTAAVEAASLIPDKMVGEKGPVNASITPKPNRPPPKEQIKLTKAGCTYAGKTAFLSHFFNCDFT